MLGFIRPVLAEFIGTFLFVFVGAGAIVADSFTRGAIGWSGIALAHGLVLSVLISSLGGISGAHFNPAVTLGLFVAKRASKFVLIGHVSAQILGAILAGFLLRALIPAAVWRPVHLGAPAFAGDLPAVAGLVIEIVLTLFLMLTVLGTRVDPMAPKIGGFGVGMAYAAGMLVAGPLTGAAMNPARAFGLGVASGFWENQWLFWIGPLAGAALISWLYPRHLSETI
jgi:MIP family channel proteins